MIKLCYEEPSPELARVLGGNNLDSILTFLHRGWKFQPEKGDNNLGPQPINRIKALKTFTVEHYFRGLEPKIYLVRCARQPTKEEVITALGILFEPHKDEYINIVERECINIPS